MTERQSTLVWPTVAQAVLLTGKSKTVIYAIISDGECAVEETADGMTVNLVELRDVLAARRRGRPRADTPV